MNGLGFRKTADAIAAFVKQYGSATPRRAVFCTYDFDPARFEAQILPELTRARRWFRTLVLADGAALQKQGVLDQRSSFSRYELAPVHLHGPGVFHPKLIFLQAGSHVLVGIGSANLTAGGLGGNLELMLFETNLNKEGQPIAAGQALASSAAHFLQELAEARDILLPIPAKQFLRRVCASFDPLPEGPILHNLKQPLIQKMAQDRPASANRVIVMSPWHSGAADTDGVEPEVLKAINEALGAWPIVYTQGYDGKAPDLGDNIEVRVLGALQESAADADSDESSSEGLVGLPNRLHAKAYISAGPKGATLWMGSANCTVPALMRSSSNGNVELLARLAVDLKELGIITADLAEYFGPTNGTIKLARTDWAKSPSGNVLCGYLNDWKDSGMTLEVKPHPQARVIHIGQGRSERSPQRIAIPANTPQCRVPADIIGKLLREENIPTTLWEYLPERPVPFPISIPCLPTTDDPEALLQEALEELGGRIPLPFRNSRARHEEPSSLADDEELHDVDEEMESLTTIAHEGKLDRIAVRVEWIRRRLPDDSSPQLIEHYRKLIQGMDLPDSLKSALSGHLSSMKRRK